MSLDSFKSRKTLKVGASSYEYYSLPAAQAAGAGAVDRLPVSLKILLENLLRFEDNNTVKKADITALAGWAANPPPAEEIAYRPARVLMQDFTGVP
ncbi:MAG: aconitate hydratase, partial [Pseudomonadales bacterium]|nr:aconitate hydratase [Pseudomonadales bacterium]